MSELSDDTNCVESSQPSSLPEGSDEDAPSPPDPSPDTLMDPSLDPSPDPCSRISYTKAANYWDNVPASVNGMLGGLGQVSSIDIRSSDELLTSIWKVGRLMMMLSD